MPASAVDSTAHEDDGRARLAPVVDLASRRSSERPEHTSAEDQIADLSEQERLELAAQHWKEVLAAAGMDFTTPQPPGDVMKVIGPEMKRLAAFLVYVREGGPNGEPGDPGAGLDFTGAMEVAGLADEMAAAPDVPLPGDGVTRA